MKKEDPVRYGSAVGEAWMHCMFKIKYCHKLFDSHPHLILWEGICTTADY